MISLKSDFIHTFNDLIHAYGPRAMAENPLGINFWCQQKALYHFDHVLQVSNKSLWILILYTFFNIFPHVYSPGAGADNHLWTKFWCQQKGLVTLPICCKFQKNSLESDFIHIFACFYTFWLTRWLERESWRRCTRRLGRSLWSFLQSGDQWQRAQAPRLRNLQQPCAGKHPRQP